MRLALVGASDPSNEVSCDVRHGAKYEQRREDGTIAVQQLNSLVNNRFAKLQGLGGDEGLVSDPAPPAVESVAFWGRGIGGDWEVSIPGSRLNSDAGPLRAHRAPGLDRLPVPTLIRRAWLPNLASERFQ